MESAASQDDDGSPFTDRRLDALIERWQADHDTAAFEALVARLHGPLERLVARDLRRRGIHDPGACDDVMSLVYLGLCRLGAATSRRFDVTRGRPGSDCGWVYVRCLARSRARDVARGLRRRNRRSESLAACIESRPRSEDSAPEAEVWRDVALLRATIALLDERSRTVIELLLAGKSQAVIAHVLGVCEGTVSRIRGRAIGRLRSLLDRRPPVD